VTRKYMNERWCVRCNKSDPTPYLKKYDQLLQRSERALDIGCGNGRNTKYMEKLGLKVDSIDMAGDFGKKCILGEDPLPKRKYGVIIANYVLMFLNTRERYKVMKDINERSKVGTIFMAEMYPAKDAHSYDTNKIVGYFIKRGWTKVRKAKDRFILRKD